MIVIYHNIYSQLSQNGFIILKEDTALFQEKAIRHSIANKEELRGNANEFVEKVKSKIALIGEDNVYNSGNTCRTYIIFQRNIKSWNFSTIFEFSNP